jgi:pimeloyl-ACP methyl ester carboxylesterase
MSQTVTSGSRRREPRSVTFEGHCGVRLRGDAWGEAGAPGVVLLHGGGQTRHSWAGAGRRLAREGWWAVSLDQRGHGESDWAPRGRYHLDDFVADLRCVVRELPQPPVVVGASLGGMVALLAEGESDAPVASAVVLVDITPRIEPAGVMRIIDFMTARPDGFASLDEAADAIAAYRRHRARPSNLAGLAKNLRRGADGRYRWHWDPRFLGESREAGGYFTPGRLVAAARRLAVPTLLVRGVESDVVSREGVAEFLEAAPGARFADVGRAGHMVAGDRNDVFTEVVVGFLREAFSG